MQFYGVNLMHNIFWTGLAIVVVAFILGFVLPVGVQLLALAHTVGVVLVIVGIVLTIMRKRR